MIAIHARPAHAALAVDPSATAMVAEGSSYAAAEAIVAQLKKGLLKASVAVGFNNAMIAKAQGEQGSLELAFARSQMANQQLHAEMGALRSLINTGAVDAMELGSHASGDSHNDFFQGIADAMDRLQEGWVDPVQEALRDYLAFFQEFSKIMALLKDAISAGANGNVKVAFAAIRAALQTMLGNYGPSALGEFTSRATAERFLRDAGLTSSDFPITDLGNGKFGIGMPESVIQDVLNTMPAGEEQWDTAKYNAWLSGKDSHVEKLQHYSQVLAERFSRVNDILNNLIKVLSATIDSITEADKSFVHAL